MTCRASSEGDCFIQTLLEGVESSHAPFPELINHMVFDEGLYNPDKSMPFGGNKTQLGKFDPLDGGVA